jgi:hypothetical protein
METGIHDSFIFVIFVVVEIEPSASYMTDKCLHYSVPNPWFLLY